MHACEHRRFAGNITEYQCQMVMSGRQFFESYHQEIAPRCRQFSLCHPFQLHVTLHKTYDSIIVAHPKSGSVN